MHRRQPLPRLWLMTDERQSEGLWTALRRIPPGSGVVFRHYSLPPDARRALFDKVRRVARKRRLTLLATSGIHSRAADGHHGPVRHRRGLRSASAHSLREAKSAERAGVHLLFVSPIHPTRSHPGAEALGRVRFGLIRRQTRLPVIALGGMNARRARALAPFGIYGWAAIDAWSV